MDSRLQELRKAAGMTQRELAGKIGVSMRTIGSWERGENNPDIAQIWNCAKALGTTPDEILGFPYKHMELPNGSKFVNYMDDMDALYPQLNRAGREKALEYVRDLVATGKYIEEQE